MLGKTCYYLKIRTSNGWVRFGNEEGTHWYETMSDAQWAAQNLRHNRKQDVLVCGLTY